MSGRKVVLKLHDGQDPGELAVVATLNSKSITLNNETFDDTSDSDVDANDQLWEASVDGVSSLSFSGDGRVRGTAGEQRLNELFFSSNRAAAGEAIVPGVGTYGCIFRLESLEFGGETKGDSTFSFSLKADGAVTFTAEA